MPLTSAADAVRTITVSYVKFPADCAVKGPHSPGLPQSKKVVLTLVTVVVTSMGPEKGNGVAPGSPAIALIWVSLTTLKLLTSTPEQS